MTARVSILSRKVLRMPDPPRSLGRSSSISISSSFLLGPRSLHRFSSGQHQQVIGDDSQGYPAFHALDSVITAAAEPAASLQYTDPPFASRAPAHGLTKPALLLMSAALRRQATVSGESYAFHSCLLRRFFVAGGTESSIGRGQVRWSAQQLLVAVQRGLPEISVRHPLAAELVT